MQMPVAAAGSFRKGLLVDEYWICLSIFFALIAAVHAGRYAAVRLPDGSVDDRTKESVKRVTAFLLTLSALLLGLLISTGKSAFDKQSEAISGMSAKIAHLDELLGHYGPEADPVRQELKASARRILTSLWSDPVTDKAFSPAVRSRNEGFFDHLLSLHPTTEAQIVVRAQAIAVANNMIEAGFKLATMQHSVSTPLVLVVILGWLIVIFASLGYCSSANVVAGISEYIGAFSASAAVLLILEYDRPFGGLMQISRKSLDVALAALGQ